MRRWLEALESFVVEVILDRRHGRRADLLRAALLGLSWIYGCAVQLRIALYQKRFLRPRPQGVPVVSVGNLTVGGTGKTPLVEKMARDLMAAGRKVAILSRGYKSQPRPLLVRLWQRAFGRHDLFAPRVVSDGISLLLDSREAGDEPFMLASNLRGVPVVVDRDRVKAAVWAVEEFGADLLLLDDGFQYLRLRRGFEIALVDRQAPFGTGHLLPRGTLREPPGNLRRATHIFLTKCDGGSNEDLIREIRRWNRTADIIECAHRPLHLRDFTTGEILPLGRLRGLRAGSLCGIARPESFEQALRELSEKTRIVDYPMPVSANMLRVTAVVPPKGLEQL
ncbi:MAG: tetraacyldisaccharide 4'-kinase, partial [Terrimicrobiaceae bacterium]|nr:tetraacyldisaccharide 4'-kinase [Terrimicrobiaceae bacterium]